MSNHSPFKSRVLHHVTNEPLTVLACLGKHFGYTETEARDLVGLGAIYSNKKRVLEDRSLAKGTYLRIHASPKRFSLAGIDWEKCVVAETKDFLIAAKPPGIPVHATLDNISENLLHQLRERRNIPLFVTQRLDVPASGLLVFGKTTDAQREFNFALSERRLEKRYHALAETALTPGLKTHFMEPSERSPRRVSEDEKEGWLRCELEVRAVHPTGEYFETEIDLITGRTHQIRAQLGAMKASIAGDGVYGARSRWLCPGRGIHAIALSATFLRWTDKRGHQHRYELAPPFGP